MMSWDTVVLAFAAMCVLVYWWEIKGDDDDT